MKEHRGRPDGERPDPGGRNQRGLAAVARFNDGCRRLVYLSRIARFTRPPILIGGAGRSGTTLLLAILGAHPHIHAYPEESQVFMPRKRRAPGPAQHWVDVRRMELLLSRLPVDPRAHRWCEKTPPNVKRLKAILNNFGDGVRFIHIIRDGRDVVTSRHPRRPRRYHVSPRNWIRNVRPGWAQRNDPRVLTIYYENLVTTPQRTLETVCRFIDEPFCSKMLDFHEHTPITQSIAWWSEVGPFDANSIGRWKDPKYDERVSEFMRDPAAVQLMRELGYLEEDTEGAPTTDS